MYQVPSSSIRSVAKDLLARIQELSHQSKTNYLSVGVAISLHRSITRRVSD